MSDADKDAALDEIFGEDSRPEDPAAQGAPGGEEARAPDAGEEGEGAAGPPVTEEPSPEAPPAGGAFALGGQSEAEMVAEERARREAEQRPREEEQAAEDRRKADTEAQDFRLSGSDRPADVAASGGQQSLIAPRRAYTPNQGALDFDAAYDNAEIRPGTTEEQKSPGIAAVRALFARDRRADATVLGSALWKDFQARAGSELIGKEVRSAEELGLAAQILRDPRFETPRVFFVKDGKVVGHTGWTSRLPGAVAFALEGRAAAARVPRITRAAGRDQVVAAHASIRPRRERAEPLLCQPRYNALSPRLASGVRVSGEHTGGPRGVLHFTRLLHGERNITRRYAVIKKGRIGDEHTYYRTREETEAAAERIRTVATRTPGPERAFGVEDSEERVQSEGRSTEAWRTDELGVAVQRVLDRRKTDSIRTPAEALARQRQGTLKQHPQRAGFCFKIAAEASAAGLGDMVIGVADDGMGSRIWHAVVQRDGAIYDPTFPQWFEPGVYEALGFSPRLTLTPERVRDYIIKSRGIAPDARNQGLGEEPDAASGSDRPADVGAAGGQQAMFSRTSPRDIDQAEADLPRPSEARLVQLADDWLKIAEDYQTARYGNSSAKGIEQILKDMRIHTESVDTEGGGAVIIFGQVKNEAGASVPVRGVIEQDDADRTVWVDSGQMRESGLGSALYQAAMVYAKNNDMTFIGDPSAVSGIAAIRRNEQMASAALRLGTTKWMRPSWNQSVTAEWRDVAEEGDRNDRHNIGLLLNDSAQLLVQELDEIKQIRYNFGSRSFEWKEPAKHEGKSPEARLDQLARTDRARDVGGGDRSLRRAVVTLSLLERSRTRKGQGVREGGVSAGDVGGEHPALKGVRYARGGNDAAGGPSGRALEAPPGGVAEQLPIQAPPSAGLSVSAFRSALERAFGKSGSKLLDAGILVPLADQSALPDHIVPYVRSGDTIFGFYDPKTDKTYAVLSNLSESDVRGLALHEVGVHYGFKRMLGEKKYAQVMRQLDAMEKAGNERVRAARRTAQAEAASGSQVAEETLAYLVQRHPEMAVVRRVIAAIRAFLFRHFGAFASSLTVDDMAMLAKAAVRHAAEPVAISESELSPALARTGNENVARLNMARRRMDEMVDMLEKGQLKPDTETHLGETPWALQMVGAPGKNLYIKGDTLLKVLRGKEGKHGFQITADAVREIPEQLLEPMLVFRSENPLDGEKGAMVVVTEITDRTGNPIIVPVHVNKG